MKTQVKLIDPKHIDQRVIMQAATVIRCGGLVGFPTETVYGLGADAFNVSALKKIYEAKGRPSDNPLILHIASRTQLEQVVANIPEIAEKLIDAFWPGPLTLILPKKTTVSTTASGGLDTIAVRYPENIIARCFIRLANCPIAAPSANSSGRPSPTKASHVLFDLDGKVDFILNGGSAKYGLESTILDLTTPVPTVLRPGSITPELLESVVGPIRVDSNSPDGVSPKAPGMKYTHYAPLAEVTIITGDVNAMINKMNELAKNASKPLGILASKQTAPYYNAQQHFLIVSGDRNHPETIAANLFTALRRFDYNGIEKVYAEGLPEIGIGLAIMNRLKKSAGYRIIEAT